MYKNIENINFHIFADNKDEYRSTKKEALKIWNQWYKNGYRNIRLYTTKWDSKEGISEDVDCIKSIGSFPE